MTRIHRRIDPRQKTPGTAPVAAGRLTKLGGESGAERYRRLSALVVRQRGSGSHRARLVGEKLAGFRPANTLEIGRFFKSRIPHASEDEIHRLISGAPHPHGVLLRSNFQLLMPNVGANDSGRTHEGPSVLGVYTARDQPAQPLGYFLKSFARTPGGPLSAEIHYVMRNMGDFRSAGLGSIIRQQLDAVSHALGVEQQTLLADFVGRLYWATWFDFGKEKDSTHFADCFAAFLESQGCAQKRSGTLRDLYFLREGALTQVSWNALRQPRDYAAVTWIPRGSSSSKKIDVPVLLDLGKVERQSQPLGRAFMLADRNDAYWGPRAAPCWHGIRRLSAPM